MAINEEDKALLMQARSFANARCMNMLSEVNAKIKNVLKDCPEASLNLRLGFAFTPEGTKRVVFSSENEAVKAKMIEVADSINSYLKDFHDCGIDVVLKMGVAPGFTLSASQVSLVCWVEDVKNGEVAELMKETFKELGAIKVES